MTDSLNMQIATWASGYLRGLPDYRDVIVGVSPDGAAVRLAFIFDAAHATVAWCDLLPEEAKVGYILTHACDHLLDKRAGMTGGATLQVKPSHGELWKFALCSMLKLSTPRVGTDEGESINVIVSYSSSAPARRVRFNVGMLCGNGIAHAGYKFNEAGIAWNPGITFVPPPPAVPQPFTREDLARADRAFED